MHLKGLAMAPMQTPMCCFYRLKDSPLNSFLMIYSIIFYSKELTWHEATDPSINTHRPSALNSTAIFSIM